VRQTLVGINNLTKAKKAQADATILQATAGYNNAKKDYDRFVILSSNKVPKKELMI
jgi:multidrug resistance efflux pump